MMHLGHFNYGYGADNQNLHAHALKCNEQPS